MNGRLKWILPTGGALILALGGLVYASMDGRVKHNEVRIDAAVPILSEIKVQVERNGRDIQRLLEVKR